MLRSTARKQLTHAAAFFALALLCAQTLLVAHDHQTSETELCAVCSTSIDQADSPRPIAAAETRIEQSAVPAAVTVTPAESIPAPHQARAPPIG